MQLANLESCLRVTPNSPSCVELVGTVSFCGRWAELAKMLDTNRFLSRECVCLFAWRPLSTVPTPT